jgi:NAD(P)-dependent dehydrogenase (short-subunit alcohol dehydrogenase family)
MPLKMTALQGKTALVTGVSRGIRRATAVALAAAGTSVLVHYRRAAAEAIRYLQKFARPADMRMPQRSISRRRMGQHC